MPCDLSLSDIQPSSARLKLRAAVGRTSLPGVSAQPLGPGNNALPDDAVKSGNLQLSRTMSARGRQT